MTPLTFLTVLAGAGLDVTDERGGVLSSLPRWLRSAAEPFGQLLIVRVKRNQLLCVCRPRGPRIGSPNRRLRREKDCR